MRHILLSGIAYYLAFAGGTMVGVLTGYAIRGQVETFRRVERNRLGIHLERRL